MNTWTTRDAQATSLGEIEQQLAGLPDKLALSFELARLLTAMGRLDEAKRAYAEILGAVSLVQFGALNNLGTLHHETGSPVKAILLLREAVARNERNPIGHFNLAHVLYQEGDLVEARRHYETALKLDPEHVGAHEGLAHILTDLGEKRAARSHYQKAFQKSAIRIAPYRGTEPPIPLLLLASSDESNVAIRPHLSDTLFQVITLVVDYHDPEKPLPEHQVVFNAIGDAELSRPSLDAAIRVLAKSQAPLLNRPQAVLATGRAANAHRFATIPDVIAPKIATLPRCLLNGNPAAETLRQHGFAFPFLLRVPGFHTGRYFVKVGSREELAAALPGLPGEELTVIEYLDARSRDGRNRKYRVMMIDGKLYPLHLAISNDWKVHYFTAGMADSPLNRAEDALFLQNMSRTLGPRAIAALEKLCAALGLDYAGVDFSLDPEGRILLFEANAAMNVLRPPNGPQWDYRRPSVQAILNATREMIVARAGKAKP